jgi:hypothetical protein
MVGHRRPHDGDPELFYAWDNLVALARGHLIPTRGVWRAPDEYC